MPLQANPIRRTVAWTALLAIPVAIAFTTLVALGNLKPGPAFVAGAASIAGIGLLVYLAFRGLVAIELYLEARARGEDAPRPRFSVGPTAELASAAVRWRRELDNSVAQLQGQVKASEAVINHVPDPLLLIDRDGQVIEANIAARRLLGQRIVGRALSSVLRDPGVIDAAEKALAGLGTQQAEFSLPAPVEREYLARISPLPPDLDDRAAGVLALQDFTAVKRIDQMRADFIANVSHELRTPLSTLIGFIETLRGPASEDETARGRFLTIMQEQAERMSRLIRDLMSLSRIEMHEHSPPTDVVDVTRIVQSVTEIMQIKAGEKDVRFRLDVPDSAANVIGDEDELMQVVQNLVDNAIKYSRPSSTVSLTIAPSTKDRREGRAKDHFAISIADEGEGIPQEHLPRLTERFYRVDSARSRQMGGTGLGLAIVKHIMNRHGGALHIESRYGEGSTFTITIPAKASKMAVEGA